MSVSRTSPSPKNEAIARPRALSSLTRVVRTTLVANRTASQPATAAPQMSTSGALLRVSKNASAIPGRAACDTESPSKLCFRSTAKLPSAPLTIPSAPAPRATICVG